MAMTKLAFILMLVVCLGAVPTCNGSPRGNPPSAITAQAPISPPAPPIAPRATEHPCEQCMIEDTRLAAHQEQVVVSARYLGLKEAWLDGKRTKQVCTRSQEVMGIVRFALTGPNPWLQPLPSSGKEPIAEVDLPCPELSRPAYAKLYHYEPDDTLRDGLGHGPILRRGRKYRLTFVRDASITMREPGHATEDKLVLTLVAVNP